MRRLISMALMLTFVAAMAFAQGAAKKVYDERIDPMAQIIFSS